MKKITILMIGMIIFIITAVLDASAQSDTFEEKAKEAGADAGRKAVNSAIGNLNLNDLLEKETIIASALNQGEKEGKNAGKKVALNYISDMGIDDESIYSIIEKGESIGKAAGKKAAQETINEIIGDISEIDSDESNNERNNGRIESEINIQNSNNKKDDDDDDHASRTYEETGELVYAIFEKGIVLPNENQTLRLDAKDFKQSIRKVEAVIISPKNVSRLIELKKVEGSYEYGTWEVEFTDFYEGKYKLSYINIYSRTDSKPNREPLRDTSFMVSKTRALDNSDLEIIYALLNKSIVSKPSFVMLTVDARDSRGIESIIADVSSNRNERFQIKLSMVNGNRNYGTWQGKIQLKNYDTTYSVLSLRLNNSKKSKVFELDKRNVYVEASKAPVLITSNVAEVKSRENWLAEQIKKPMTPTYMGFGLSAVLIMLGLKNSAFFSLFKR